MARDKANTNAGVKFTLQSAKEIADVVRQVKSGDRKVPGMQGTRNSYATPHYLSQLEEDWPQDGFLQLTIWAGDPGDEQPSYGDTVWALNKFSAASTGDWVILARANGFFYRVGAGGAGGLMVGTYSGSWANGGASTSVYEPATELTYTVYNYLTPISGPGGNCVFGPDFNLGKYVLCNFDLTKLDNYTGATQVLGSEGSALKWFDAVICT